MARFEAPSDRAVRAGTWATAALLLALPAVLIVFTYRDLTQGAGWFVLALCVALPLALPLLWAFAPVAFSVEGGALRVERPLSPRAWPLEELRAVALLPPDALRGALRTMGVGGAFGFYGRFWSRDLGPFLLHARRRGGPFVLVETARGERLVLAPDDAARLRDALLAAAPGLRGAIAPHVHGSPSPRRFPRPLALVLVVTAVLTPAALGVFLWAAWARAPAGVALDGDAVVVERRHAAPVALPLSGFDRVELLSPAELAGLRRTAGVALGSARYGTWRSAALGSFALYAHRGGPWVLLEGAAGRVVVSPDDPARFVSEARARLPAR